jgi:pyrroline-5-carboxylate reductase
MLSNAECANACKYLILAVKPQYYDAVLKQIHYVVTPEHVIVSLAPGISIEKLRENLGADRRIVRAMPNTPAASPTACPKPPGLITGWKTWTSPMPS